MNMGGLEKDVWLLYRQETHTMILVCPFGIHSVICQDILVLLLSVLSPNVEKGLYMDTIVAILLHITAVTETVWM